MKAIKKTLYFTKHSIRLFRTSTLSASMRFNQVSDRYLMMCDLHGLDFNRAEKKMIVKVLGNRKKITADMIKNIDVVLDNSVYAGTETAVSIVSKLENVGFADLLAELERLKI